MKGSDYQTEDSWCRYCRNGIDHFNSNILITITVERKVSDNRRGLLGGGGGEGGGG